MLRSVLLGLSDRPEPEREAALAALSADLDAAIGDAVLGLRSGGYSWAEIASRLGVTRQAAHQRWASTSTDAREVA